MGGDGVSSRFVTDSLELCCCHSQSQAALCSIGSSFAFASLRSVSSFEKSRTDVNVPAPPDGSKVALWRLRNHFRLWRHGDDGLEQFLAPWFFDELAFHSDSYPE